MNLELMTMDQLLAMRARKAAHLAWAKENKMWAHAGEYLDDMDRINIELARRAQTNAAVEQGEIK